MGNVVIGSVPRLANVNFLLNFVFLAYSVKVTEL